MRWDNGLASDLGAQIFRPAAAGLAAVNLRAFVRATPFQRRVWRALLHVPVGALISCGRLAAAVERPTAARAVGTVVANNLVAFLIPCHQVIRETGVVGQYRWGHERKRAMLGWESAATVSQESGSAIAACM